MTVLQKSIFTTKGIKYTIFSASALRVLRGYKANNGDFQNCACKIIRTVGYILSATQEGKLNDDHSGYTGWTLHDNE
jgi:hypothetical protein